MSPNPAGLTIGAAVRELRRRHRWSQPALSQKLKVSRRTLQRWESGGKVDLGALGGLEQLAFQAGDSDLKEVFRSAAAFNQVQYLKFEARFSWLIQRVDCTHGELIKRIEALERELAALRKFGDVA